MYFKEWIKKYEKDEDPIGDLARDVSTDIEFPSEKYVPLRKKWLYLRIYLEEKHACDDCLDAFDEAWEVYERCERKRLKRRWSKK